ncbi:hypothetical protein U5903_07095 [Cereibacter johrii]|uniref:hypothetical protein n=1 Tax=Cereibacter johrii TaxID=445629 RepID=UPI002B261EDE|nr:hypothetical protein [Cereibacter johrii]MEA5160539.1 hypothetical protein [Cereibacter johrii]
MTTLTTTIIRAQLAAATTAREAATEATTSGESDRNWRLFDDAVDQLLEALGQSDAKGMLALMERFEMLGVTAGALPAPLPAGETA